MSKSTKTFFYLWSREQPLPEKIYFLKPMTFKCLNQLAPSYLTDLLIRYQPLRKLRSSDKELLVQPRCHLKTYGERAFSFIAPKLWNTLTLSIKRCKSIESFKSTLKTYLFENFFFLTTPWPFTGYLIELWTICDLKRFLLKFIKALCSPRTHTILDLYQ